MEKHLSQDVMLPVMQGRLDCDYTPEPDFNQNVVEEQDQPQQ